MIKQNFYPGMNSNEVEFFTTGEELKVIQNGKIFPFTDINQNLLNILKDAMLNDSPAHNVLMTWHPNNESKQIEQFTKCRYGGLDFNPDIDSAGKLQKGEYWECSLRGSCKSEGIVCKQIQYNGHLIDNEEIKLIKLLVTDKTNDEIAEELQLKLGTLHFKKRVLYEKLEITTKQELTIFAFKYNLIHLK